MPAVILLREPGEVRDLTFLFEDEGADVFHWPLLSVSNLARDAATWALAEQVARFTWVIPESPTAVRVLAELVRAAGAWSSARRAAFLAPNLDTVRSLARHGWEARHVLPERVEGRLETLGSLLTEDDEVLWLGGPGHASWQDWLGQVPGRATVMRLYDQAPSPPAPEVGPGSLLVVHSPSAAEALAATVEASWLSQVRVVASGPTTEAVLSELGVSIAASADRPTTEAVFEAAQRALQRTLAG
jgi:uroporphyrinogen-III synthase